MKRTKVFLCKSASLPRPPVRAAVGLVLAIMSACWAPGLSAQDHTADLHIDRAFPVTREHTLEVRNKYGKIEVVNWDRASTSIEVDIHLQESSASKLRKLKDDVSIDFRKTGEKILVQSNFKSESGRLASELKSVGHTISGTNKNVEINYTIYVPDYINIILVNKFGDVYMDMHKGHVDIDLSNGVLKTGRLEGVSNLNLSFANGMIEALGSSTLHLSYCDISLGDAGQLDLYSKSSKLKADSVNVLKMNSRRDKLHFQRVEYFYGNSNFTEAWIYDFLRESDVYMRYGKLTIEHVFPEFHNIYVESDYTDISLTFDEESAFDFDILYHERSVVRLPSEAEKASEEMESDDHFRTTGRLGKKNAGGKVTIDALQKCYVNISKK